MLCNRVAMYLNRSPGGLFKVIFLSLPEYANPEVLSEYASKAAQVSLQANEKTTIKVGLIPRGEYSACLREPSVGAELTSQPSA
jgi:hypothetical protein